MNDQLVSFEMTDELRGQLSDGIRSLDALLAFTINLTVRDRIKLQKMGDKSIAFVEKAIQFANDRPDLVPPYLDVAEFQRDYTLAKQLKELFNQINPVVEKISDTYLAAGSDAFSAARKLYSYVKAAAASGAPGSDSISAELKKRYTRIRRKTTSDSQTTSEPATEPQQTAA